MVTGAKTVEMLRIQIEVCLRQKGISFEVRPNDSYGVRAGTTKITIYPLRFGDHTVVRLLAPLALNITKVTPELTRFLAEKNNDVLFGKFSLDTKNKIVWFENALLGETMDDEELLVAVATMATTADTYDEAVSRMSGGKRFVDT